jgi:hypothetical protein
LSDVASVALGGAIAQHAGDLTVSGSSFEDNQVSASAPNGRYVDSGAVITEGYTVTMSHDVFRGNSATLDAARPDAADSHAQAGAVNVGMDVTAATIRDTEFSDNSVTMTNTAGDSFANSGAVHGDVLLTLGGDVFAHNSVVSQTLPGSPGNAQGDSGGGEVSGSITGTSFTGNTVTVRSAAGDAKAWAGAAIFSGTLTQSLVNDNRVVAASPGGTATLDGAGLQAGDFAVTLRNTDVTANTGVATGRTGTARGGGIFDSPVPDGPPGGPLRLASSHITRNTLTGGFGVTVSGGGVFSTHRVDLADSVIARNSPDQCVGC